MNYPKLRLSGFALLGLVLMGTPVLLAQADDPEAYGDDYQAGDYGRLRYLEGGATIVRADGEDVDDRAASNAPLFPGDRIRTGRDQRVEIQLAGGTVVRLDRETELTLQSLPRPYAKYRDNTVILLDRGVVRVDARIDDKDEFRIDAPAGSVYLLGDGDFRVEADPSGRLRVFSRRGVAEVVGEGGSVLVRGGSRTTVYAGTIPEDPRPFSAYASDAFDRWVDSREDLNRSRDHYANSDLRADDLPYEVRPYYRELSSYGQWVRVPDYGWAWYPVDVSAGWRPYNDGAWSYGSRGYFWVGNEPWGWAPYRYGRWSWVGGYGWCWIPGRVFAGSWVSWSWGSLYVGWAPLDFWGRPAFIGGTLYGGYYDPGCWTFVSYQHVGVRDVRRHAVPIARVGDDVRGRPAVLRAPRVSPQRLAESSSWRERAARQAVEDSRYRVRPIAEGRTPTRRLQEVEDRIVSRNARSGDDRGGRAVRDDRSGRTLTDDRRAVRPSTPGSTDRVAPGSRGTAATDRVAPANRGAAATDRDSGRDRVNPGVRAPSGRARDAREPYPRRIAEDPRGEDRGGRARGTDEAAPAPREERGRGQAPRDTNERVRDLYDRLSRPREMREAPPRERAPESGRAAPAPPARRPEPPQQAEPRREAEQQAPRAQPRPQPAPRREPAKPAPKQERERGGQKGEQKKDRR